MIGLVAMACADWFLAARISDDDRQSGVAATSTAHPLASGSTRLPASRCDEPGPWTLSGTVGRALFSCSYSPYSSSSSPSLRSPPA